MDVTIVLNMAMELIFAIEKYVHATVNIVETHKEEAQLYEKLEAESYIDFTPNPEIKAWIQEVDHKISPFLKNDIAYFFGLRPLYVQSFYNFVLKEGTDTPKAFLNRLSAVEPTLLMNEALKCYGSAYEHRADREALSQEIKKIAGEDEEKLVSYLLDHPEEFKEKSLNVMSAFYTQFFEPFEGVVKNKLEMGYEKHNTMLREDAKGFINTIGLGDYSKLLEKNYPIRMILSYYLDLGVSYTVLGAVCYVQYGVSMEQRFNRAQMETKYKNIFKALSDETRREIIRLTSTRPWYNRELAEHFGLTSATLSYHLNILLDLEILQFDPNDTYRYYYVANRDQIKMLFRGMQYDLIGE